MKNVLITGGAGFIGSSLTLKLINQGYLVTVLDNLSPQIHTKNPDSSYTFNLIRNKANCIIGDIRDVKVVNKAIENQNIIIHLAAETGTGQSMYEIDRYVDVNVRGTALLLDAISNNFNHKITKIILSSSRAVYGEGRYFCNEHGFVFPPTRLEKDLMNGDFECKCPICKFNVEPMVTNEGSNLNPVSIYGLTKLHQENLVKMVCENISLPYTILRFQNVFGVGQSLSNPYTGILSIFSKLINQGNEINIFEDGLESRDFVYVDDVVESLYLSIVNENSNNEIFNVGGGRRLNVVEVTNHLANALGKEPIYKISGDFRKGDIRHNIGDLTKIKSSLNYEPKKDIIYGFVDFVNWSYKHFANEDSKYIDSLIEMEKKGMYFKKHDHAK